MGLKFKRIIVSRLIRLIWSIHNNLSDVQFLTENMKNYILNQKIGLCKWIFSYVRSKIGNIVKFFYMCYFCNGLDKIIKMNIFENLLSYASTELW